MVVKRVSTVEKRKYENIPEDRGVASRSSFIIVGCQVHRLAYGVRCDGGCVEMMGKPEGKKIIRSVKKIKE
jgi:hypothetical protein